MNEIGIQLYGITIGGALKMMELEIGSCGNETLRAKNNTDL